MKTIEASGNIKKGDLNIYNNDVFWQQIMDIGFVNHIHITLEYGNKRTLNQNNYAWAVCVQIATRMRQDGWDVDKDMVYRGIEENHCKEEKTHPETGEVVEFIKPLKKQDSDRFAEIIDEVRHKAMKRYPDIYIKAPHEYYEMTLGAYNRWKMGEITKTEAIQESKQKLEVRHA